MVKAGFYLLARLNPTLRWWDDLERYSGWGGVPLTALLGAVPGDPAL